MLKDANPSGERQKNIDPALGHAHAGPHRRAVPTPIRRGAEANIPVSFATEFRARGEP